MYLYLWYFVILSFLGWCLEVTFHAVKCGKFVNRGFLAGAVCPIYGVSFVLARLLFNRVIDTWLVLFLLSMLLATAVELMTGFLMDRIFDNKWWDYSNEKFNLYGYICLKFSLAWGLIATLALKLAEPLRYLIELIPKPLGLGVLTLFLSVFALDLTTSVLLALSFSKRLKRLSDASEIISSAIETGSDLVGVGVYKGASRVKLSYDKLLSKATLLGERFIDAFPSMRSHRYEGALEAVKKRLGQNREAKKTNGKEK